MPSHFAGLSRMRLDPARWATRRFLKMAEFGVSSSLYEQPLHCTNYLLNLPSMWSCPIRTVIYSTVTQNFRGSHLLVLLDHWVYVWLSVLEEKIPVFYLGKKTFRSRTQLLAMLHWRRLSDFLLLSFVQLIESSEWDHVFILLEI